MTFGISTLGPCAEAMGISVMMVFCIGVAQLPVMIGLAMHVPAVRMDLYSPYLQIAMDPSTNQSAVVLPLPHHAAAYDEKQPSNSPGEGGQTDYMHVQASYMHGINISGLFVLCSSAFTFFVVLTMQFIERGIRDSSEMLAVAAGFQEEFIAQNTALVVDPSFRLWNQSFAAATLLMHFVAAATVLSPVSTQLLVSISLLFLVSLGPMVHPLDNYCTGDAQSQPGMASVSSQKVMLLGGIFLAAVMTILANIVLDIYAAKAQAILLLAFLDCFMLFGHLWDRVPTLQVIVNCRLVYVTLLAIFNAGLLCMWDPYMRTSFVVMEETRGIAAAAGAGGVGQ